MSGIDSVLLGYQRAGVTAALPHPGFLLLMPMGSGKTLTALAIVRKRYLRGRVDRVLVVCQKTIIDQWIENIREWLPGAVVLDNPKQKSGDSLAFYVTNYENARNQLKILRKCGFHMMIVDECHKLKGRDSKQSRRLGLIGKSMDYRLGLTGTPVEGNELDFWAQMRFIDHTIFGDTWTDFKEEWTRPAGFMGKKARLMTHRREEFLDEVRRVSFIVTDQEALGLPEGLDITIPVRMSVMQSRAYRQMEDDLVVQLPGIDAAAPLVVTQMMRLQQITGGFVVDDRGEERRLGTAKIDALKDFLDSHTDPLVVYARFLWEIEEIRKAVLACGRKPSVIAGDDRTGNPKAFDVLACQVGIVAGLDGMQHVANSGFFYSKPYSRIQYDQARSRLRRKGQKNQVKFYHPVVKNTVDIDLMESLQEKHDLHLAVVQHMLKRRRN